MAETKAKEWKPWSNHLQQECRIHSAELNVVTMILIKNHMVDQIQIQIEVLKYIIA